MQNLKKNWLMFWKMIGEIRQFFTRALKSLKIGTLMGFFIQSRKWVNLKFTEELCVMAIKNDVTFGDELTCCFKIGRMNLTNFDPNTWKVSKICTLMSSFWWKYIMFELKRYRGVMFDSTEDWCKNWSKTDLCF